VANANGCLLFERPFLCGLSFGDSANRMLRRYRPVHVRADQIRDHCVAPVPEPSMQVLLRTVAAGALVCAPCKKKDSTPGQRAVNPN